MEEKNFEYDSETDSLHIYKNNSNVEVKGSLIFGNLIFDVDGSGKVVSLEVDNTSVLFKTSPETLSNIENAEINVIKEKNILFLGFKVFVAKKEYNFSYMIPQKKIALTC